MAHYCRHPQFSSIGFSSSSISRRCFSQYRTLQVRSDPAQRSVANSGRPTTPLDRSLRVMSKGIQNIPSDLGLLESTFIPPTGNNAPSLLRSPSSLLKLQWHRLTFFARDRLSLLVLKWSSPAVKKWYRRSIKLNSSNITPTAIALHRQMYTAFAEGEASVLRKLCTDGLYDSFKARIASRSKGEKVQWELVGYNKRAKVVSHRAARLPIEGAAIRQAVVRICSKQKLTRWKKGKEELVQVEGSGKERNVVEYVVVQRRYENWKEGDWQAWGTTGETGLGAIEAWKRRLVE